MGMTCEIILDKPNSVPIYSGERLKGTVKFSVDKPTEFTRIFITVKGYGKVKVIVKSFSRRIPDDVYTDNETYFEKDVDISDESTKYPAGVYDIKFSFGLPKEIPSSVSKNIIDTYERAKCEIRYYLRVQFDRPGCCKFAKKFKKDFQVVSAITPKLQTVPLLYEKTVRLSKFFSTKDGNLTIKASILNSVIILPMHDQIQIKYEVCNNSDVKINYIESTLLESTFFKPSGYSGKICNKNVRDTTIRTGHIGTGVFAGSFETMIHRSMMTIQNSSIFKRDYFVRVTVKLPMLHDDIVLNIPVEIGSINTDVPINTVQEAPAAPSAPLENS